MGRGGLTWHRGMVADVLRRIARPGQGKRLCCNLKKQNHRHSVNEIGGDILTDRQPAILVSDAPSFWRKIMTKKKKTLLVPTHLCSLDIFHYI